ncbi:hypothetical protein Q1695_011930 [Nippostrongylus brasiliensis]|nr:hypothetical protein Q1695_011930 [Nippostrongylus brasiliensis]
MNPCAQMVYLLPMWIGVITASFTKCSHHSSRATVNLEKRKEDPPSKEQVESRAAKETRRRNSRDAVGAANNPAIKSRQATVSSNKPSSTSSGESKTNDLEKEVLFTAPDRTLSYERQLRSLKIQRTQLSPTRSSEELCSEKKKQKGSIVMVGDDGTLVDTPSLDVVGSSVDSEASGRRVQSQSAFERLILNSGESVIGEGEREDDDNETGNLVEKAESEQAEYERKKASMGKDSIDELAMMMSYEGDSKKKRNSSAESIENVKSKEDSCILNPSNAAESVNSLTNCKLAKTQSARSVVVAPNKKESSPLDVKKKAQEETAEKARKKISVGKTRKRESSRTASPMITPSGSKETAKMMRAVRDKGTSIETSVNTEENKQKSSAIPKQKTGRK